MLDQISSLNYLKTFVIVSKHLSFKDAAKVLNITPTAVSHQIKSLETQLRVQLFERHTRAISLTSTGAKLAHSCQDLLTQLDHALDDIRQDKNDISISCCNSFAALWLTPRSAEINHKFPRNTLKICASDSLIDLRREKHIDLALRYGLDEGSTDEVFLGTERIALYRSPHYQPQKNQKPILYVTHWPENGLLKNINWKDFVDSNQFEVKTFEQEYFVLQAIMTGQGYGLLSNVLSATALSQGWIQEDQTISAFDGYSYWLRMNPDREGISVVEQFSDWMKQELGQMT
ncbi:LysR family transcriptional regulator [Litoribrevibacter albus]|uniref:Transcriptional regulator n=1 Tax=Litoribrevibacter albus TaxID=1473156 RepID=A0AA37S9Q4_9GAMM|nr:LysR family transcriptional regulator [Litoribrevibacter albus]GLQ30905.1 transcriptional regulator [Litoribrevibacter albus]